MIKPIWKLSPSKHVFSNTIFHCKSYSFGVLKSFHSCPSSLLHYKYKTYPGSSSDKIDFNLLIESFNPKAVLLVATPDQLQLAESKANEIARINTSIQLILCAFDTVGRSSLRSGISTLWSDENFKINKAEPLGDQQSNNNWRHEQGKLTLSVSDREGKRYDASLTLANTLFTNDTFESLYISQPKHLEFTELSGVSLKSIDIELPSPAFAFETHHQSSLLPLPFKEKLVITDCKHNMIKLINGKPASSLLQDNIHLMSVITKETRVFARISKDGNSRRYEVIGGGGSWGPKARLLALSPEPNMFLPLDSEVDFYYLDGSNKVKLRNENNLDGALIFECSLQEESEIRQADRFESMDCFGIGSEKGYLFNGQRYNSSGDSTILLLNTTAAHSV